MTRQPSNRNELGLSLIEIVVVLMIIGVLTAISVPYIVNYKKVYKSEDQAFKVIDLMREASQIALIKRRTMRFEIDLTDNAILLIDENGSSPDSLVKKIPLEFTRDVRMDVIPATVTKPNPPNYTDITFSADSLGHLDGSTNVSGHSVWAGRFRSDGTVVNSSNVPISVNIYCWPPLSPGSTTARNPSEIRVITVFGGSGALRYWKYNGTSFVASQ